MEVCFCQALTMEVILSNLKVILFLRIQFHYLNFKDEYFSRFPEIFSQFYAELPLEPSLSRTLMEANNYGCITEALTVASMLSIETSLLPGKRLNHLIVLHIFN